MRVMLPLLMVHDATALQRLPLQRILPNGDAIVHILRINMRLAATLTATVRNLEGSATLIMTEAQRNIRNEIKVQILLPAVEAGTYAYIIRRVTPVDLVVAAAVIHEVAAEMRNSGIIIEKTAAKPTAKGRTASFLQRIAIR